MKYLFFSVFLSFLLVSFNRQNKDIHFTIKAEITGMKDDSIFLFIREKDPRTLVVKVDTFRTVSKNGGFSLSGQTSQIVNGSVMIGTKGRKNFSVFLEEGTINVRGHIDSIEKVRITGTPENEIYTEANLHQHIFYDSIDVLYKELKTLADKDGARAREINRTAGSLRDSVQQYWIDFVGSHPNALTSGIYLYVLQDRTSVETLERLYNGVSNRIKNGVYGPGVKDKIVARKRTALGNPAPAFATKDLAGKNISLASYKGKYLLLDFWASWCVPCRAENPALKTAYEKFKDKGLVIVSVSLDTDADKWKEAIAKDGLPWIHTIENGFDNPIAKLYGVQPIPDNFLISPDGKILGRALRGEELEMQLSKYIK